MPTDPHSEQTTTDGIHVQKRWEHASAGARTGATYTAVDEGGISHQTDDDTYWRLHTATGKVFVECTDEMEGDVTGTQRASVVTAFRGDAYYNTVAPTDTQVMTWDNGNSRWAPADAASGSGDVVGPASSVDNTIPRFNSTTGKLMQVSSIVVDDSNNISGVVNSTQSGYIQLTDMTAPSNPSAGEARLYKKTGDDGLFYLPDAGGAEVDLTASGGGAWPRGMTYTTSFNANYATGAHYGPSYADGAYSIDYSANYGSGPSVSEDVSGFVLQRDATLKKFFIDFNPSATDSVNQITVKLLRLSKNLNTTTDPTQTVLVSQALTHPATSRKYQADCTLTSTTLLEGETMLVVFTGSGTVVGVDGSFFIEVEY